MNLPDLVIHKILEFVDGSRPLYFNWNNYWNWKKLSVNYLSEIIRYHYPYYYWSSNTSIKYYDNLNYETYRIEVFSNSQLSNNYNNGTALISTYSFVDKNFKMETLKLLLDTPKHLLKSNVNIYG
jgi:hypothetical protein|uniref:Uncharacterized protein n=1 Tax=viral metagenome TaxID=1070528 RepID=A0A6C0C129_9ZZZZ